MRSFDHLLSCQEENLARLHIQNSGVLGSGHSCPRNAWNLELTDRFTEEE